MYHFPIEGFYKTEDYSFYKKKQQEVQQLESKLIYDFKDSLLNKTKGKYIETLNDTLKTVYEIIGEIISKPINTEGV